MSKNPDNLYQREGIWYARIQVGRREHRESLRTRSRSEAKKRLKAVLERAQHFAFYGENRHTWQEAVVAWAMHATGGKGSETVRRYQTSLRAIRGILDHLYLDEITRQTCAAIAKRPGVSNATRRRDLTAISAVLRYAVSQGWRDDNPAREWDRSVISERRDPIALPSAADIDLVVSLAGDDFGRLIRFAQYTGMRQKEAVYLERRQIRGERADLTRTKTNRPRTVPLDERAVGTIDGTVVHMTSPYVFRLPSGDPFDNCSGRFHRLAKRAEREAKKAGRPFTRFRFHDLRHWYAVDYLRRGGNIYTLSKLLGHSSLTTTEIYLDYLDPAEQERAKFGAGVE